MSDPSLFDSIKFSLKSQGATWFVALLIAILTAYSSRITESIKFALNRADSRTKQFEELAQEVSQFIFNVELVTEFIEKDWTIKETLTGLITDYNNSIKILRQKEFVYLAWVQKYWDRMHVKQYETFMQSVRDFDAAMHLLNDEFEAVNITGTKPKVDRKTAEAALKEMKPASESVRDRGKALLLSLM